MRRIAALLLVLFALACLPASSWAQSGRSRNARTSSGSGTNSDIRDSSDTTANDVPSETDGSEVNPQGETLEGDVLRVNTTLVTVPVSVKDRDGKYIPDLRREDFRIFEEGVEQRVAYFATVDQPFTVALVMDTSRSTNFKLEDIQDAAIAFINQLKLLRR
jgi:Ca-activated chloride channel family protein